MLASARRLRLGDLDLPAAREPVDGLLQVDVRVPTLGTGVARQVRLYDRDGLLLDATDRLWTLEQINMTISSPGSSRAVTIGDAHPPDLLGRLQAADTADERYRQLLEAGLPGRIVTDEVAGPSRLHAELARAREELLVLDPYFGWNQADWAVLDDAAVPVRVLTGHGTPGKRGFTAPPAGMTATLDIRTWRGRPPWHDRMYLWRAGGLTVGTSPSGLGRRVARLDRVAGVEADRWRAAFETWWADPLAQAPAP
jgi:hypothetical protein